MVSIPTSLLDARNLDIVIKVPKPSTPPPPPHKGFPPSLPAFKVPKIPPAVKKAITTAENLVKQFQKLAGLVGGLGNNQTVTLILKQGATTLFSQKVTASSVAKKFI